ncbi:hypothetical protein [Leptospira noguchii]|uniref:hypothetical protein n=1 Tax=Leptospira noguchii TaxID=28182 RepID=UPI001E5689DA|nr:hypothetical protein [Leptospira noguchii]UOG48976.1 hypothetical protein MAL00_01175 [Leptospira noguchii]
MSFLRGRLGLVATHEFAVADLDSSMDRGPSPAERPIGKLCAEFRERSICHRPS